MEASKNIALNCLKRITSVRSPASARTSVTILFFIAIQMLALLRPASSFVITTSKPHYRTPLRIRASTTLFANRPASSEFELQELRAQFNAMLNQKIRPKMLAAEKRIEIESYVENVMRNCASPVPLKNIGDDNARAIHGNWTLVFASENAALGDLPSDSTVEFAMYPDYKCDYKIRFAKTLGLESLTAKSDYSVDSSPVNPGLVTFVYQDIVAQVLGNAIPVGLFGLLKGRANYIETVWFDGKLWFERGFSRNGIEFYNVYIRE